MPVLNRDQIFQAKDITTEVVPCEEWGGDVIIKVLSGAERDAFEASMLSDPDADGHRDTNLDNMRARLVAACAVDETGQRLFVPDDVEALGKKSAVVLARLFTACQHLNKMREEDIKELKKASGPSDASTSD